MGVVYSSNPIVTKGLVLYLDAGNPKSYPGSGAAWYDLSGNGNNGSLVNSPAFNSNNEGSIIFDGVNDYVSVNHNSTLNLTSEGSIIYSVKPQWNKNWTPFIGKNGGNSNDNNYRTWVGSDKQVDVYNIPNGSDFRPTYTATSEMSSGKWSIVSIVFTSTGLVRTFIDGILKNSRSGILGSTNTRELRIGNDGGTAYGDGSIGFLQIYNTGLTDVQILENFNVVRNRYGL